MRRLVCSLENGDSGGDSRPLVNDDEQAAINY